MILQSHCWFLKALPSKANFFLCGGMYKYAIVLYHDELKKKKNSAFPTFLHHFLYFSPKVHLSVSFNFFNTL